MSTYTIRPASREEFRTSVDWAADEGWNPGLKDGDLFHPTDPQGFLMGFLDDEPISTISVVRYGNEFGFLGFYIVKPEYRGQGYGLQIWNAGMAHLDGRTVGLDGVIDQQDNYRKSGFVLAHRNIRFEAQTLPASVTADHIENPGRETIAEISGVDTRHFGTDRPTFLPGWLTADGHVTKIARQNGRITGYGIIRPCRSGHKIGPLFAQDGETADSLFLALCAKAPNGPVYLDVPEPNGAALALARRYGMTVCFETARMYAGTAPDLPLDQVFGITTFELG